MQGQYMEVETGLCYNTFRYYDPDIGRFISEDPIGLEGGANLYAFAPNTDAWVDPWGWSSKNVDSDAIFNKHNESIQKAIDMHDYKDRPNSHPKVPGCVSGAIGYETATGKTIKGKTHTEKGRNILNTLKKTLRAVENAFHLSEWQKRFLQTKAAPYLRKLHGALAMKAKKCDK
jgi:RHS repeat-associated protein